MTFNGEIWDFFPFDYNPTGLRRPYEPACEFEISFVPAENQTMPAVFFEDHTAINITLESQNSSICYSPKLFSGITTNLESWPDQATRSRQVRVIIQSEVVDVDNMPPIFECLNYSKCGLRTSFRKKDKIDCSFTIVDINSYSVS